MPKRIQFHLDENVDPAVAVALRQVGIDVTTSKETSLLSKSDLAQLEFAKTKERVLVTHDDDFLILDRQGVEHCGIIYSHKDKTSIGYLIRMMILLHEVAASEELKNRVEFF